MCCSCNQKLSCCRWCGGKFLWLMPRDDYWLMPFKILTTSNLFYFLIGKWVEISFNSALAVWLVSLIWDLFILFLQLCASISFWLYLQLSDECKYQLCRLVCHALLNGASLWVFIELIGLLLSTFLFLILCPLLIQTSLFLISFKDPGPVGNGRYSDHMLPEIEVKDFRKGAQVFSYLGIRYFK